MNIKSFILIISLCISYICKSQQSMNSSMVKTTKSQTISLKKGELFLAVIGYQMPDKESLLQEYFSIVFPPAQKNGFTPLGQLPIKKVASGNFMPNEFIGLFKWPNMQSVQAFLSEVSPDRLTKLRMKIWSELKQHMVVVQENTNITFKEDKIYEMKMLWTNKKIKTKQIIKKGGTIVLNSPVAGYEDLGKNTAPNHLLIIEWDSEKIAEKFNTEKGLKVKKEEAFYTSFAFPKK